MVDAARAMRFYRAIFGWTVEAEFSSCTAPGLIGNFDAGLPVVAKGGPVPPG